MEVFFTSDLHIGHENAIKFDNRPFNNAEEMTEELIRKWNSKVKPGDLVYVLGDMIWKMTNEQCKEVIQRLNGQIILIKGNHDRFVKNADVKKLFAAVKDYDDISVQLQNGKTVRVVLSHYFMPFYVGARYQGYHLYGHFHNSTEHQDALEVIDLLKSKGYRVEAFNVGCMHWNYEPVTLDEILKHEKRDES